MWSNMWPSKVTSCDICQSHYVLPATHRGSAGTQLRTMTSHLNWSHPIQYHLRQCHVKSHVLCHVQVMSNIMSDVMRVRTGFGNKALDFLHYPFLAMAKYVCAKLNTFNSGHGSAFTLLWPNLYLLPGSLFVRQAAEILSQLFWRVRETLISILFHMQVEPQQSDTDTSWIFTWWNMRWEKSGHYDCLQKE